jgi:tetratricopeptide (TPR) repeat protein
MMIAPRSSQGLRFYRRRRFRRWFLIVLAALLVTASLFFALNFFRSRTSARAELLRLWKSGAYEEIYNVSGGLLKEKPLDYEYLTIHGFAAYQMGAAQISKADTVVFIDECIESLRRALLVKPGGKNAGGNVFYVLGKAYYYKGEEYAGEAVKYLEMARDVSYQAGDIPQYLGLAYAALKDYYASIAAFTEALTPVSRAEAGGEGAAPAEETAPDSLLLAIAKSYLALGEAGQARAYLVRCIETSKDARAVNTARFLLGGSLAGAGDREGAKALFQAVLDEEPANADALFQMGEMLAAEGSNVRARAMWRAALRSNPAHKEALARLGL